MSKSFNRNYYEEYEEENEHSEKYFKGKSKEITSFKNIREERKKKFYNEYDRLDYPE